MPRSRRIMTRGGSGFDPYSGEGWGEEFFENLSVTPFVTVGLPFQMNMGGRIVTRIAIWEDGFVSFGDPTQTQIDWVAANPPPANLAGFPGDYIAVDHRDLTENVRYAAGLIDFEPDPDPSVDPPYSIGDAVDIFRITWTSPGFNSVQLQLTQADFAIVDSGISSQGFEEAGPFGFRIGGYRYDPFEQPIPDHFFNRTFGGAFSGSRFADTIGGTRQGDLLDGLGGNDLLIGGLGDDTLIGGAGADRMEGGARNDIYSVDNLGDQVVELAGGGNDTARATIGHTLAAHVENLVLLGPGARTGAGNGLANFITGTTGGNNRLSGLAGDDRLLGQSGFDTLDGGADADTLYGAAGNDQLAGGDGNDRLFGEVALDTLNGGAGDDELNGGGGGDTLDGGAGDDRLNGGIGIDTMTGGAGLDRFAFRGGDLGAIREWADIITDFSQAEDDRILLGQIDAKASTAGINEAFTFIGTAAFTGAEGQLRYFVSGGDTFVTGDANGDGAGDFFLRLEGSVALVATDFGL